jgi:hypothetical protein
VNRVLEISMSALAATFIEVGPISAANGKNLKTKTKTETQAMQIGKSPWTLCSP